MARASLLAWVLQGVALVTWGVGAAGVEPTMGWWACDPTWTRLALALSLGGGLGASYLLARARWASARASLLLLACVVQLLVGGSALWALQQQGTHLERWRCSLESRYPWKRARVLGALWVMGPRARALAPQVEARLQVEQDLLRQQAAEALVSLRGAPYACAATDYYHQKPRP